MFRSKETSSQLLRNYVTMKVKFQLFLKGGDEQDLRALESLDVAAVVQIVLACVCLWAYDG